MKANLNKDYAQADYVKQFTVRIPQQLAKIDRIEKIYKEQVLDAPKVVYEVFSRQRDRLKKHRKSTATTFRRLTLKASSV